MKSILLVAYLAYANAAKLNRAYLPPYTAKSSGGSAEFLRTPLKNAPYNEQLSQMNNINTETLARLDNVYTSVGGRGAANGLQGLRNVNANYNERPRAALERSAGILRQDNEKSGDGYSHGYETENGIVAEESGFAADGVEARGGYSYIGDDGQVYSVRYTAGQNGFVPEGDHLPTPPPVPEQILLALEQNARDEAAGVYDDGSYKENKYASGIDAYQSTFASGPSGDDSVVVNSAADGGFHGPPSGFTHRSVAVNKAYLPPTNESGSTVYRSRTPFDNKNRQANFNPRDGYNY